MPHIAASTLAVFAGFIVAASARSQLKNGVFEDAKITNPARWNGTNHNKQHRWLSISLPTVTVATPGNMHAMKGIKDKDAVVKGVTVLINNRPITKAQAAPGDRKLNLIGFTGSNRRKSSKLRHVVAETSFDSKVTVGGRSKGTLAKVSGDIMTVVRKLPSLAID